MDSNQARGRIERLLSVATGLLATLALCAPGVRADATASVSVGTFFCKQQNNGPSSASASSSCTILVGSPAQTASFSGSATVDAIGGTASASVTSNDPTLSDSVNAGASWNIQGTITGTGSGLLTLADSGMTASTTGPDTSALITLEISDPTSSSSNSACENSLGGCGATFGTPMHISLLVNSGDTVFLTFGVSCNAIGVATCSLNDPVTLSLPSGLQFDSGIPGFLSGPPSTTPEPATLLLLGTGLVGLAVLAHRKAKVFARTVQPSCA